MDFGLSYTLTEPGPLGRHVVLKRDGLVRADQVKKMVWFESVIRDLFDQPDIPAVFYEKVLNGLWPRVAGEKLVQLTRPGSISNGRLTILVKSSYWRNHLTGMEEEWVKKINRVLRSNVIQSVIFQSAPSQFHPAEK